MAPLVAMRGTLSLRSSGVVVGSALLVDRRGARADPREDEGALRSWTFLPGLFGAAAHAASLVAACGARASSVATGSEDVEAACVCVCVAGESGSIASVTSRSAVAASSAEVAECTRTADGFGRVCSGGS